MLMGEINNLEKNQNKLEVGSNFRSSKKKKNIN